MCACGSLAHSQNMRPFSYSDYGSPVLLRAADWKLDAPDWTGRMRVTARGKVAYVKLEDKISGETNADKTVLVFTPTAINHSTV